jgi:hypothetical protein
MVSYAKFSYRSDEDAVQNIDPTRPARHVFVDFGGPQAHGYSFTVTARSLELLDRAEGDDVARHRVGADAEKWQVGQSLAEGEREGALPE